MKTRQLQRTDLPDAEKRRDNFHSLHVPVLYKGKKKYVCDINFADETVCYLEDNNGEIVKIAELQLIIGEYYEQLNKEKSSLEKHILWLKKHKYNVSEPEDRVAHINKIINTK